MAAESARARAMEETRSRILDVARELLGQDPDAGMGEVAAAAGVVRRTVYGHFPSRGDLVRTLAERAAEEITAVLKSVDSAETPSDAAWARFVERLWPLAHRYRVLLALRRSEYGDDIHALLGSVDALLESLIRRGQREGAFGTHLPPGALAQLAYAAVFTIADDRRGEAGFDARSAAVTSLLLLGVPADRAHALADVSPRATE